VFDTLLYEGAQGLEKHKILQKLYGISDDVLHLAGYSDPEEPPAKRARLDPRIQAGFLIDEINPEPPEFFDNPEGRKQLKTRIKKLIEEDSVVRAIDVIKKELEETYQGPLVEINLEKRVQGELSRDLLKQKLCWGGTASPDECRATQGFLHNWIDRATDEELTKFVWTVCSNRALGPRKLTMELYHRGPDFIPVAHTCTFTLELSVEYPDQDTFDKKLNLTVTEGLESGFPIA
jgi:hypothetical protein